jgi:gliding motility-associated-like protein
MKASNFILFTLILGALACGSFVSSAQVIHQAPKVYRVTAYKKFNHDITSTSNYARVEPLMNVYIPNAFTPNGDGINDTFGIKGEGAFEYSLVIFNRWGEKIFESNNPNQQWDGTYKSLPVQPGEYVYQLMAHGKNYKGQSGVVTLVR